MFPVAGVTVVLTGTKLNAIRAVAQERLAPKLGNEASLSDEEMGEIVQETRVDLSVWLKYLLFTAPQENFISG